MGASCARGSQKVEIVKAGLAAGDWRGGRIAETTECVLTIKVITECPKGQYLEDWYTYWEMVR